MGFLYVMLNDQWRPFKALCKSKFQKPDITIYEEHDTISSSIFTVHNRTHLLLSVLAVVVKPFTCGGSLEDKPITDRSQNHEYYVDHDGRQFVIRSNLRHQNFDLFTTDVDSQTTQLWELLQAGSDEEYITDFLCLENHLIVMNRIQGLDQVQIYDNDSKGLHQLNSLTLPTRSIWKQPEFRQRLCSTSIPMTSHKVIDYNLSSRSIQVKKIQIIPSGYSEEDYRSERILAEARDGIRIQ